MLLDKMFIIAINILSCLSHRKERQVDLLALKLTVPQWDILRNDGTHIVKMHGWRYDGHAPFDTPITYEEYHALRANSTIDMDQYASMDLGGYQEGEHLKFETQNSKFWVLKVEEGIVGDKFVTGFVVSRNDELVAGLNVRISRFIGVGRKFETKNRLVSSPVTKIHASRHETDTAP